MENHQTILQIEVDGRPVDIHARVQGVGPTILFVHGWLASNHIWKDVFDRLPETCRLVAIDLPGFGQTPPLPNGPTTIAQYASIIAKVADRLSTEGAIHLIVADSLGAITVLHLMQTAPLPAGAVMLSGCPIDGLPKGLSVLKRKGVVRGLLRMLQKLPVDVYHRVARGYTRVRGKDPQVMQPQVADAARAAEPDTAEQLLRELFTPVSLETPIVSHTLAALVVRGQNDHIAPAESARKLATYLNARYLEIDHCGHTLMMENPDAYAAAIRSMLNRNSDTDSL